MNGTDLHRALDGVLNHACPCSECGLIACRPGASVCAECCTRHAWLSMPDHRVCGDCGHVQPDPPLLRAVR